MPSPILRTGTFYRGSPAQILDLLQKVDDSNAFLADITSFSLYVYDESQADMPLVAQLETNRDPIGYVEPSLRTDLGWAQGGEGWSFRYQIAGSVTENWFAGQSYRFEFVFATFAGDDTTPAVAGPIKLSYSLYLEPFQTGSPPA